MSTPLDTASAGKALIRDLLKGPGLARLTVPSDANIYGNVHGGTILKMMEEAGNIVATRYCNNAKDSSLSPATAENGSSHSSLSNGSELTPLCYAVLVRIERMDFLLPMMIGEIAELTSEIIYTSPHSLLVQIEVFAENIVKGMKRKTNQGHFWYVPVCESGATVPVQRMIYKNREQEAAGEAMYSEQKMARKKSGNDLSSLAPPELSVEISNGLEAETVAYSYTSLTMLVGRNDVSIHNYCRGGVLLKLMDECAGIVSAKHCHTNVVTACLHATNFHRMIKLGSLVTVSGRVTFTSNRSLEVEVVVDFESPFRRSASDADPLNGSKDGSIVGFTKQRAVDAFFTYVSIGTDGKALPIPPLKIKSEEEGVRFSLGQQRYESRRQKPQQKN